MSFEAITWALAEGERRQLEPAQRFLLLLLGSIADPVGGTLFPSHGYLARRTGMSRATVKRHMKALDDAGLLQKDARHREHDGSQTSNVYQLAMQQHELALPPPAQIEPGATVSPGSQLRTPPQVTATTPREVKEVIPRSKATPAKGAKAPSAVAGLWAIYSQGVKAKHNGEPAPSARANGMLSQVVARIGANPAKAVVEYYLNHRDPWYGRQLHDLRWLVRDCEKLWLELQQRSGGGTTPAQKSVVHLLLEDGVTERHLEDCPVGDALEIAKRVRNAYARMIATRKARGIKVRIGDRVSTYTIEELRT